MRPNAFGVETDLTKNRIFPKIGESARPASKFLAATSCQVASSQQDAKCSGRRRPEAPRTSPSASCRNDSATNCWTTIMPSRDCQYCFHQPPGVAFSPFLRNASLWHGLPSKMPKRFGISIDFASRERTMPLFGEKKERLPGVSRPSGKTKLSCIP
jgi:hypothetical protein